MSNETYANEASLPYSAIPSGKPSMVFGRDGLLSDLTGLLLARQSVTLVGLRHIGISTVLRRLASEERLRFEGLLCFYFDLEKYQSIPTFFQAVLETLRKASLPTSDGTLSRIQGPEGNDRSAIRWALETLRISSGKAPVLLFDHFDRQVGGLLDKGTIDFWRALIDAFEASVVTSYGGPVRLRKETHYYNNSAKLSVGFLTADAVHAMLTVPLEKRQIPRFSDEQMQWITRAGGSHPYFLSLACRTVLNLRNRSGVHERDYDDKFALDAGGKYYRYLSVLTENQRLELCNVASRTTQKPMDPDVKGLCATTDDTDRIFAKSFEDFVLVQCGKKSLVEPPVIRPANEDHVLAALLNLGELSLSSSVVVGQYMRHDERVRNDLKDLCKRISAPFRSPTRVHENFLIWAKPGSGKTFLIQELAVSLRPDVKYVELNLAAMARDEFVAGLQSVKEAKTPVLCLLDEIDARDGEDWPYEEILAFLDLNRKEDKNVVFVLIGSRAEGLEAMLAQMSIRKKGHDLMSRVPNDRRVVIPETTLEDRAMILASHVVKVAKMRYSQVREIEKMVFYYVLTSKGLESPRQLSNLASDAVQRMAGHDDRLRYGNLFEVADIRNQLFFADHKLDAEKLSGRFVQINP